MSNILSDLQRRRAEVLEQISRLGNFRAGCVSALVRRCGKPGCRCSLPNDPGHGPNIRLTYKENGKTYSESLADPADLRRVQREIAEFRTFQRLMREFIEINGKLCRLPFESLREHRGKRQARR